MDIYVLISWHVDGLLQTSGENFTLISPLEENDLLREKKSAQSFSSMVLMTSGPQQVRK